MTDRSLDSSGPLTRFFDSKFYGLKVMAKAATEPLFPGKEGEMKRMMLALALPSVLMAWPRQGEVCVTEASHGEVTMTESDGRQVKAHCVSDCEAALPKGDINAVFERDQVTLIWPVNRDETKAAVYEVKEDFKERNDLSAPLTVIRHVVSLRSSHAIFQPISQNRFITRDRSQEESGIGYSLV